MNSIGVLFVAASIELRERGKPVTPMPAINVIRCCAFAFDLYLYPLVHYTTIPEHPMTAIVE